MRISAAALRACAGSLTLFLLVLGHQSYSKYLFEIFGDFLGETCPLLGLDLGSGVLQVLPPPAARAHGGCV